MAGFLRFPHSPLFRLRPIGGAVRQTVVFKPLMRRQSHPATALLSNNAWKGGAFQDIRVELYSAVLASFALASTIAARLSRSALFIDFCSRSKARTSI